MSFKCIQDKDWVFPVPPPAVDSPRNQPKNKKNKRASKDINITLISCEPLPDKGLNGLHNNLAQIPSPSD